MKSSSYSKFCFRLFKRLSKKIKPEKNNYKNLILEQANITITYDEYLAMALFTTLLISVIGLVAGILLFVLFESVLTLVFLFAFPLLSTILPWVLFYYYPLFLVSRRASSIDRFLPYAVNFVSTMSETGLSPGQMFLALSETDIYGELKFEAEKISREINVMGIDSITALQQGVEHAPSAKLKSFLQGMVGTLQSGSNLGNYFDTMVQQYMEDDLLTREKNLEFLALIAELFVMSVIAFPLFLVIIISVMGFVGGSNTSTFDVLFLLSFLVLPLLYLVFYFMIKTTTISEIGKSKEEPGCTFTELIKNNRNSVKIFIVSTVMIIALLSSVAILSYLGYLSLMMYDYLDIGFLSLLLLIGPFSFYSHAVAKKKIEIQDHLPDFFVGVSNSLSAGMNIFDSMRMLAKRNFARLTAEVKKMNAELSWHLPIKRVFFQFSDRMKNPLIQRSVLSINRGLEMGGDTPEVFKAAARELQQVNQVRQQRNANMSMYMVVIMMCFFVFIFIMYILDTTLFSYFFDIQMQQTGSQGMIASINPTHLQYGLYSFVFVQGIGSGMLAGYFTDGNLSGGLRFSFLLGILSILMFKFVF